MKVYKFYGSWCQPCKMLTRTLEDVNLNGHEIVEVDIDEDPTGLTQRYGVRGVPAMIMIDDKQAEVKRLTGYHNETKLNEWFA